MTTPWIKYLKEQYYQGMPVISDEEYDALIKDHEESIGANVDGHSVKFKHKRKMYSLQKVFVGETEPPNYGVPTVETPKLDGAAISINYIYQFFGSAITRGNGEEGLDVSTKIEHLVPKIIKPMIDTHFQVTGEVVAPKTIKNARNYAAGALRLKSVDEFKEKDLTFIAYDIWPRPRETFTESMKILSDWGFKTVLDGPWDEFPQDGKVIRVDNYDHFESLGYTAHHPRAAYALKERKHGVVTKLIDVEWNTGKSGVITPTAILEPVEIDGAVVSRATLHNIEYIRSLELEIGCNVEVIRSGEIIPRVVRKCP